MAVGSKGPFKGRPVANDRVGSGRKKRVISNANEERLCGRVWEGSIKGISEVESKGYLREAIALEATPLRIVVLPGAICKTEPDPRWAMAPLDSKEGSKTR